MIRDAFDVVVLYRLSHCNIDGVRVLDRSGTQSGVTSGAGYGRWSWVGWPLGEAPVRRPGCGATLTSPWMPGGFPSRVTIKKDVTNAGCDPPDMERCDLTVLDGSRFIDTRVSIIVR